MPPDADAPPSPFTAVQRRQTALLAADRAAPTRLADLFDFDIIRRRRRPDPTVTAAAMPAPLRRVLTLASDRPAGLPVWALAQIAGWPKSLVVTVGERLHEMHLVRMSLADDGDIIPTASGRAVADVLNSWRMPDVR